MTVNYHHVPASYGVSVHMWKTALMEKKSYSTAALPTAVFSIVCMVLCPDSRTLLLPFNSSLSIEGACK